MRMPERRGLPRVGVVVMPVIMAVHMNMLHFFMFVMVGVLIVHQKINGKAHDAPGADLHQSERFPKEYRREHHSEKGRRRKDHLRARCAELLRRRYIERQAETVCQRADQERLTDRRGGENMGLEDQT